MTTINEALTPLGDGFRNLYGINDKLSAKDMTKLLSGVELRNFMAGNSFEATFKDQWISQNLTGPSIDDWNKYLAGKVVTFSCDAEWTDYDSSKTSGGNRFFFEIATTDTNNRSYWNGLYFTPTVANGKQHLVSTSKIVDTPIKSINSCVFWDELNPGCYLKVTNIKMTVDPLGGVAPLGLFNPDMPTWKHPDIQIISQDGYQVVVLPPATNGAKQFETTVSWEQGKAYRWTFEAKAEQAGDVIHTEMWGGGGYLTAPLTTDWKEYSSAGKPNPAHNNFYFWNPYNGKNVYLRNIKIYEA